MRKFVVILIVIGLIASFSLLLYYGFRYSRGVPVSIEEIKSIILEVPLIEKEIDLSKGIESEFWDSLDSQETRLLYQNMVLPWPKAITPSLIVKAFHNSRDIYFYLSWKDDSQNLTIGINKFSDACAIMFPLADKPQPPTVMMGFLGKANIWQWKASQDREFWFKVEEANPVYADYYYPFEEKEVLTVSLDIPKSAANDLIAIRAGTITPKETQDIQARGFWQEGAWQVVFKRQLKAVDLEVDAVFSPGKRLCGFAVWNGQSGDRGGRKSISEWVELEIR